MKKKLLATMILFCSSLAAQQSSQPFVIEADKPFVYVKFDHVGPRQPLSEAEPAKGVFVRFVNNCRAPIGILRLGGKVDDQGIMTNDEIVRVSHESFVTSEAGITQSRKPVVKLPRGYSDDFSELISIAPGTSILLSFPRNHVSLDWYLRIHVDLMVSSPKAGLGPWIPLEFTEWDIPEEIRSK